MTPRGGTRFQILDQMSVAPFGFNTRWVLY